MSRPFKVKKGKVIAQLSRGERRVLEMVCQELTVRLTDQPADPEVPQWARELGLSGVGESRPAPEDPVVARLLPDAYQDPQQAAEFRGLTEAGLRATKLAHIEVVRAHLHNDPIVITDQTRAWLAFLADARLMLGTLLDISEDDPLEPRGEPQYDLYLYLGYLQQSLVEELLGHRA